MSSDLRTWWSTASPRERDARVAALLGARLWERRFGPDPRSPGVRLQVVEIVDPRRPWKEQQRLVPIPWEAFSELHLESPSLPPYSTSWEHAASLLDRLNLDRWDYRLAQSTHGQPPYFSLGRTPEEGKVREIHTRGDTAPDAIALAFCLAKEAQA